MWFRRHVIMRKGPKARTGMLRNILRRQRPVTSGSPPDHQPLPPPSFHLVHLFERHQCHPLSVSARHHTCCITTGQPLWPPAGRSSPSRTHRHIHRETKMSCCRRNVPSRHTMLEVVVVHLCLLPDPLPVHRAATSVGRDFPRTLSSGKLCSGHI
jgi:hypothetical protein